MNNIALNVGLTRVTYHRSKPTHTDSPTHTHTRTNNTHIHTFTNLYVIIYEYTSTNLETVSTTLIFIQVLLRTI